MLAKLLFAASSEILLSHCSASRVALRMNWVTLFFNVSFTFISLGIRVLSAQGSWRAHSGQTEGLGLRVTNSTRTRSLSRAKKSSYSFRMRTW